MFATAGIPIMKFTSSTLVHAFHVMKVNRLG